MAEILHVLTDACAKWEEVGLEVVRGSIQEQGAALAEQKELYVENRKELVRCVRAYKSKYLQDLEQPGASEWTLETNELIEKFKATTDQLSAVSKIGENLFVCFGKLLSGPPDPCPIFSVVAETVKVLLQRALEIDEERRKIQDEASTRLEEVAQLRQRVHDLEEQINTPEGERVAQVLKQARESAKEAMEMQRAEFDRARLEVQEEHDARVSALDETICTLMSKLQAQADDAALSEEFITLRRQDRQDQRTAEAKIAQLTGELECGKCELRALTVEHSDLRLQHEQLQTQHSKLLATFAAASAAHTQELEVARRKLDSCPPANLSEFLQTLEIASYEDAEQATSMTWDGFQKSVAKHFRSLSALHTKERVRAEELTAVVEDVTAQLTALRIEYSKLQSVQDEKDARLQNLEQDLVSAHTAVEAGRRMLSAYVSAAKGGKVPLPSQSECSTTPVVSGLPPAVVTVVTSTGSLGAQGDVVDGTSKFMLSGLDAKDRLLQAVQSQRDSYKSQLSQSQNEVYMLKSQLQQLKHVNDELYQDNTALVKQLKAFTSSYSQAENAANIPRRKHIAHLAREEGITPSLHDFDNTTSTDMLNEFEEKYRDGLQRHALWGQTRRENNRTYAAMNKGERLMVRVCEFLLRDSWTRHGLILYVVLLHLCAILYVRKIE